MPNYRLFFLYFMQCFEYNQTCFGFVYTLLVNRYGSRPFWLIRFSG